MSTKKDDLPVDKTFVVFHERKGSDVVQRVRISARDPIIALNRFHRLMQDEHELKHHEYKITRLSHRYAAMATITPEWMLDDDQCIYSDYDLPATNNPDIKWERKKVRDDREAEDPTKVMPFYDEVTNPAPENK